MRFWKKGIESEEGRRREERLGKMRSKSVKKEKIKKNISSFKEIYCILQLGQTCSPVILAARTHTYID